MTVKYFSQDTPPLLKRGELASNGQYLFIGIGSKQHLQVELSELRLDGGFTGGNAATIGEETDDDLLGGAALGNEAVTAHGGAVGDRADSARGGAVGARAKAIDGAAVGLDSSSNSGAAVGKDSETDSGGAVGHHAKSLTGGAVGMRCEAELGGGAVGAESYSSAGGFAGGYRAKSNLSDSGNGGGAAIGNGAEVEAGAAVGKNAKSESGAAVGANAESTNGFAGGYNAKATANNSVQLGPGTNDKPNSIQFKDKLLATEEYVDTTVQALLDRITALENA